VSRIARVEAWPVNVPLEAAYEMAPGIVAGIHRTIVRITTDDGIVGLGETPSPEDAEALLALAAEALIGRDTDELRAELASDPLPTPDHRRDGRVLIRKPLTGIEIALWDVAGREAGLPLYELFGGMHRAEVGFSEYFAYRDGAEQTPVEVAAFCARMIEEHGSTVFEGKVAVRSAADDVRLAREVRAAIGPDRTLRLDANMGWRPETAEQVLRELESLAIANVEEPVASFEDMARLRSSTAIPFSAHTPDVTLAAELGSPDTLVIGLGPCGGISGTRRFVASCEDAGVGFWFYSGDLGIATAAYLHIAAATPYVERPSQSLLRWTTEDVVVGGPFSPENGVVEVPTGPGLGVELDTKALERCVERFAREGAYDYYGGPSLPRY
jgi:glucarate dehydratase